MSTNQVRHFKIMRWHTIMASGAKEKLEVGKRKLRRPQWLPGHKTYGLSSIFGSFIFVQADYVRLRKDLKQAAKL